MKDMTVANAIKAESEVAGTIMRGYVDYLVTQGKTKAEVLASLEAPLNKMIEGTKAGGALAEDTLEYVKTCYHNDVKAIQSSIKKSTGENFDRIYGNIVSSGAFREMDERFCAKLNNF